MTMHLEQVNNFMTGQVKQSASNADVAMNGSVTDDPEALLKAQYALQKYTSMVSYHSTIMKTLKDMISGIIQKF